MNEQQAQAEPYQAVLLPVDNSHLVGKGDGEAGVDKQQAQAESVVSVVHQPDKSAVLYYST